jgi:hypothetical protein
MLAFHLLSIFFKRLAESVLDRDDARAYLCFPGRMSAGRLRQLKTPKSNAP